MEADEPDILGRKGGGEGVGGGGVKKREEIDQNNWKMLEMPEKLDKLEAKTSLGLTKIHSKIACRPADKSCW